MKSWGHALSAVPVALAVLVSCAEAPVDDPLYGILATEPADAGKDKSIKLPETEEGDDDDDDTTSSSSSSSTTGGPKDAGPAAPPKDAGPPPLPANDPCTKNTCSSPKDLGSMSADEGAPSKTFSGASSRWFTITAEETETGLSANGRRMRLKTTLTSPPGHNFDLFVYGPSSAKQCTTVAKKSESLTDPDIASLIWGEADGSGGNGSSDTAMVTIEVREIGGTAGTCDPTAKWDLKVEGNKQ